MEQIGFEELQIQLFKVIEEINRPGTFDSREKTDLTLHEIDNLIKSITGYRKDIVVKKESTACFTGHRPPKLNGYNLKDNVPMLTELKKLIEYMIVEKEVTTFISGMALGIDMWAAMIVLKFREKLYPHIKLVCAIPCDRQFGTWKDEKSIDEWHWITEQADYVHYVSTAAYTAWCMQKRNEWMVDNAKYTIAVWDGTKGGTGNCVKYAQDEGALIVQLHPKTFQVIEGDKHVN